MADRKCEECDNPLTLLLNTYACDWCDGVVAKEWDKSSEEEITEPTGWGKLGQWLIDSKDLFIKVHLESSGKKIKAHWSSNPANERSGSLEDWFDYQSIPFGD